MANPVAQRRLRRDSTSAEVILWAYLRGRRLDGFKFRRQHPLPPYIVDFYCPVARLVVEVDGARHFEPEQRDLDTRRTDLFSQYGVRVLRFTNRDVLENIGTVLDTICNHLPPSF